MTPRLPFNLYVCACSEDGGLYRYTLDSGKLTFIEKYPIPYPMYAIERDNTLYVILKGGGRDNHSSLVKYSVNPDGSLTKCSGVWDTEGVVACHLDVVDGEVYVVNYLSGNVVKIGGEVSQHEGKGPNEKRQDSAHTHYVGAMRDGNILVTDLTLDAVFTYDKNLVLKHFTAVPSGQGPRHLVQSADGKHVFCACELGNTVCSFFYRHGRLQLQYTYGLLPDDFKEYSIAAAIRERGGKLYVSNRGHDSLTVFDISGGKLSGRRFIKTYGKAPRDFDIFADYIVATNQDSDTVTVINKTTGELCDTISVPQPLCVLNVSKI